MKPDALTMKIVHLTLLLTCWIIAIAGCVRADLWVAVDDAIDGDTIRLEDGRLVRYLGIDSPEINHKTGRADPFGHASLAANRNQVKGNRLRLELGKRVKDRYGRMLAYVFDRNDCLINQVLVRKGLAIYYPFHPKNADKMAKKLLSAQRNAMTQGIGLWADRKAFMTGPFTGNRRSMRFHLFNCPYCSNIRPNNRVHFNTRWDAYWAGYAPCGHCLSSSIKKELKRR